MSKIKAVIFDIDGTLTDEISWTALAKATEAATGKSYELKDLHNRKAKYGEAKQKLLEDWSDEAKTDASSTEKLFADWPLKAGAVSIVEQLRRYDIQVCLISGSLDVFARSVAKKIGVKDFYANAKLEYKGSKLQQIEYNPNQTQAKLANLERYCEKYDLKLKECACVGDSNNDIALFEATKRGILLEGPGASDQLRTAAWKTITSLSDLPKLVL